MTSPPPESHPVVAEGREAVIHEWTPGRVLRVMRSADAGAALARSTAASEAARSQGVPTPEVFEVTEFDGRPAQIMERVDGPDLFAHMAANPARIFSSAGVLAAVHAELHQVEAPPDLESMHDRYSRRIEQSDQVPSDVRQAALEALAELPHETTLCHGDYHPGNVLVTADGPVLIDWTGASRGAGAADFARTQLMLATGELPPGSPAVIRALTVVGRSLLLRLYVRGYRQALPIDTDLVDRWTTVVAADRLVDGVDAEREAVLAVARGGDR